MAWRRNSREPLPRDGGKGGVGDLVWPEPRVPEFGTIQTELFGNSWLMVISRISGAVFVHRSP